ARRRQVTGWVGVGVAAGRGRVDRLDRAARAAAIARLEVAVVAGLDAVDDPVAAHPAGDRTSADDTQLVEVPAAELEPLVAVEDELELDLAAIDDRGQVDVLKPPLAVEVMQAALGAGRVGPHLGAVD